MRKAASSLVIATLIGTFGCSSPAPCGERASALCEVGRACTSSADCRSLDCESGVCAQGCEDSADCPSGQACVFTFSASRRACSASCAGHGDIVGDPGGLICENDAIVTCATAAHPSAHCDACGCAGAGERCVDVLDDCSFDGACYCAVPAAVGQPCMVHDDCQSGNCSGTFESTTRVCEVAAGSACTTSDAMCRQCNQPSDAGGRVCRQSCDGTLGCATGICLGDLTTHEFGCYVECTDDTSACGLGERCDYVHNDSLNRRYCAPIP